MIANKYKIINKISEGEFGEVYKAENIRTNEKVAIKFEYKNDNLKMLKNEAKIYQYLKNKDGFPQLKWFGSNNEMNYLVIELLGDSIKNRINIYKSFCLKTVLILGIQMINQIRILHDNYLLHRDIKPDNFLFGLKEYTNKLYLIDLGLCKRYNFNGKHIDKKNINYLIGSPNFVSINIHQGIEPSRRDDLESCIYIITYMLLGNLEWLQCNDLNKVYGLKVSFVKCNILPAFIKEMLIYIRSIDFEETPNYKYLINILEFTLHANGLIDDNLFEWNT
jgi:serine/threonine protein kinase